MNDQCRVVDEILSSPTPPISRLRLSLLAILFLSVVLLISTYSNQIILPLFLGLLTWGKALLKSLTPKLGVILLKNSVVIQLRRMLVQFSTHFFVKSHKPWRRALLNVKISIAHWAKRIFARYWQSPLWIRTAIAIGVLLATAGSSLAVFALLIIPQPVLNWIRKQFMSLMGKLGVSQFFAAIWKWVIPERFRHRWHMHLKWTLGRRQVVAARRLSDQMQRRIQGVRPSTPPPD